MREAALLYVTQVTQDGQALEYAAEELKKDKEVVMAAVTQDGQYLAKAMTEELGFMTRSLMWSLMPNWHALEYAAEELKKDKDVVMAAHVPRYEYSNMSIVAP
eukprot:COSAG05_NODE_299_length_11928_cov_3.933469_7_plen_103_part_00